MNSDKAPKNLESYLYLSPSLVLLFLFVIIPIVFLFILSFYRWDMFSGEYAFVGMKNYSYMFKNPDFFNAVKNTLIYVIGTVLPGIILSLFLAVVLNSNLRGSVIYRSSIFLPVIVSLAATGIIWLWIFDFKNGILNRSIIKFGFMAKDWLGDPDLALFSVIMVTLWKRIGYNMVIFFAGLQVIPQHLYEAAKIDGANSIKIFRHITWPNLIPTTSFVLVINLIFSFRDFAQIYVMTRGGPMARTTTLVYHIYESAFSEFNIGYAASVSMILFAVVMIVTYLDIRLIRT